MIKDRKGSITLLALYICMLLLFTAILYKSVFQENYLYYKEYNKKYNLFLIENALIMNIFNKPKEVDYSSKELSYSSNLKIDKGDYLYKIKLNIYNDNYLYEIRYDIACKKIVSMIKYKDRNTI